MKKITVILFLLIAFVSCRRVLYNEYRHKDYYLIQSGHYSFFEKAKTVDKPVLQEIHKSTTYDTCSCVSVINDLSDIEYFNQLLIGIQFNVKTFSRDLYSSFPHDGSIEKIEDIKVFIERKKESVDISNYLKNPAELKQNIIFMNADTSTSEPSKGILFNSSAKCYKEHRVNDLNDFREKFNAKKFDDGLNTIDWYTFLFSVSPECPYKLKDFEKIVTVVTLKTKHTNRKIKFQTPLKN
jgi:hypothetical protein